jgi:spore maturation protein CgeB
VFFLGEDWFGSCARACASALRRAGCDVQVVDGQQFSPPASSTPLRVLFRLLQPAFIRAYNARILEAALEFKPDILFVFKGPTVYPETVRRLRANGLTCYNYFPDTSPAAHGPYLQRALPLYDCVFYTKRHWDDAMRERLKLREAVFIPHGYDPEVHCPVPLDDGDRQRYGCDVVLVATYTSQKERVLSELLQRRPTLDLRVWGNQWERCRDAAVRKRVGGPAVAGTSYVRALRAAKIALAIMSGPVPGAASGDHTSTRSFEIPACGAFMLHERNAEVLELYEEGSEIAAFGGSDELVEKIDYYLAHEQERIRIAAAGHARAVPLYSYDRRMAEILAWHAAKANRKPLSTSVLRDQTANQAAL